jgi:hypothetical protein
MHNSATMQTLHHVTAPSTCVRWFWMMSLMMPSCLCCKQLQARAWKRSDIMCRPPHLCEVVLDDIPDDAVAVKVASATLLTAAAAAADQQQQ